MVAAATFPLAAARSDGALALIWPSSETPAGAHIARDFPDEELPAGDGHDGQYFYVIARQPMHLEAAATGLDAAQYRLQRPIFPLAAWALAPTGGGYALIAAMAIVGVLAIGLTVAAAASILERLGGRRELALLVLALPGTYWSVRLSTADNLALALATLAVALALARRDALATAIAVLAVLAKEPIILVLIGFALWRRDRAAVALAAVPAVAAGAWYVTLAVLLDAPGTPVPAVTSPLHGVTEAWRLVWSVGIARDGMLILVLTVGLAVAALLRSGLRGPFGWVLALHLALFVVMTEHVIGLATNVSRAGAPIMLFSLLTLLTPRPGERPTDDAPPSVDAQRASSGARNRPV